MLSNQSMETPNLLGIGLGGDIPIRSIKFLAPLILLAALSFNVPLAHAVNVLQNPGFETGDFTGWEEFSCCAPGELLTVTAESPHSGAFVADFNAPGSLIDPQDMSLEQTFPAISTEDVNELSFWVRSEGSGFSGQFRAHYTDNTISAQNISNITAEWQQIDMTAILTPGKMLNRILILNSADPPLSGEPDRDFYDDFVVDAAGEATFNVTKDFSDDNPAQVSITLACSNGSGSTAVISESSPAQFVLTDFGDGVSCSITEDATPGGYAASYSADCEVVALANAGVYDCTITNTATNATFEVEKVYTGIGQQNNDTAVEVTISCNTGLPLQQSKIIDQWNGVTFVVQSFNQGELDCEITETVPAGYRVEYTAPGQDTNTTSCEYIGVIGGNEHYCEINNTISLVEVAVSKDWIVEGGSLNGVSQEYRLELSCDTAGIVDGEYDQGENRFYKIWWGEGADEFTALVEPGYPSSNCYVAETGFDNAVEVDNGCGEFQVSPGVGFACTITNTVFFEGIPTLGQYGKALMILLMLGVGLVGLRRFF